MRLLRFLLLVLLPSAVSAFYNDSIAALDSCFRRQDYEELKRLLPVAGPYDHPSILFFRGLLHPDADSAAAYYRRLIIEAPDSPYVEHALLRTAKYFYVTGNYGDARRWCAVLFKTFPQSPLGDDARYLFCRCTAALGKTDSARALYKTFVRHAVNTALLDQAVRDLERLDTEESADKKAAYYVVQAALFRNAETARMAEEKLSPVFPAVKIAESSDGRYRLLIGRFRSRDEAQRYADLYIKPYLKSFTIVAEKQ